MDQTNRAKSRLLSWRENPAQFVNENFGVEPDAWQAEALKNFAATSWNPQRRVCMKACTGPGKSALLAWTGWHRLACFGTRNEHPKGAALSKTKENLADNLWAEFSKWQKRSQFLTDQFQWTKSNIYLKAEPETWFLSARSFAKDADDEAIGRSLSGLHSQFPFILLDETGEMPTAVGRAAEQIFTGLPRDALIAQAGNPTSTTGLLYESCNKHRDRWEVITITADPDDPERTPRVDIELARRQIKDYGRDNPWVMATILGLFPAVGFTNLLGIEEVEIAMNRHYNEDQYSFAAKILGVDVARFGDDCSCIFPRQGLVALKPKVYRNLRSYELAGFVAKEEDKWQADGVIIDSTGGYGAGVVDAYHDMNRDSFECNFSSKAYQHERFYNKRAEIWWEMAEWVKGGGALPRVERLVAELTEPTYSYQRGKIIIEEKDSIKDRLGRSPDLADGLAVTFAEPVQKRDLLAHMINEMTPGGAGKRKEYDPFEGM